MIWEAFRLSRGWVLEPTASEKRGMNVVLCFRVVIVLTVIALIILIVITWALWADKSLTVENVVGGIYSLALSVAVSPLAVLELL